MKFHISKTPHSTEFLFGRNIYIGEGIIQADLQGDTNYWFLEIEIAILLPVIMHRIKTIAIISKLDIKITLKHIFLACAQQDEQFDTSYK